MFFIVIRPDYTSTFIVECEPNQSLQFIHEQIKNKLKIEQDKYLLVFNSKILNQNLLTLDDLGVKSSDIISLHHKRENQ